MKKSNLGKLVRKAKGNKALLRLLLRVREVKVLRFRSHQVLKRGQEKLELKMPSQTRRLLVREVNQLTQRLLVKGPKMRESKMQRLQLKEANNKVLHLLLPKRE